MGYLTAVAAEFFTTIFLQKEKVKRDL